MRLFALIYYLGAIDLAAVAAIVYTVYPGDLNRNYIYLLSLIFCFVSRMSGARRIDRVGAHSFRL